MPWHSGDGHDPELRARCPCWGRATANKAGDSHPVDTQGLIFPIPVNRTPERAGSSPLRKRRDRERVVILRKELAFTFGIAARQQDLSLSWRYVRRQGLPQGRGAGRLRSVVLGFDSAACPPDDCGVHAQPDLENNIRRPKDDAVRRTGLDLVHGQTASLLLASRRTTLVPWKTLLFEELIGKDVRFRPLREWSCRRFINPPSRTSASHWQRRLGSRSAYGLEAAETNLEAGGRTGMLWMKRHSVELFQAPDQVMPIQRA